MNRPNRPRKSASGGDSSALKIQIDGAARGNPGPAGVGVVLADAHGRRRGELSVALGEATNNVAESVALIIALQEALRRGCRQVWVETDSELLSRQVSGSYRVRDRDLQVLHAVIGHLIGGFARFEIRHIPRSQNRPADRLANRAVTEWLRRNVPSGPRRKKAPPADAAQPTLF